VSASLILFNHVLVKAKIAGF